jgi:hypothetical protein
MVFGSELSSQDIAKLNTSISDYYNTNNTTSDALSYAWSNGATTQSIEVSTAGDYTVTGSAGFMANEKKGSGMVSKSLKVEADVAGIDLDVGKAKKK